MNELTIAIILTGFTVIFAVIAFLLKVSIFNKLDELKKVIYYRHGLMERSETFLFLFCITLLISLRFLLLWIFAGLVFFTAVFRLRDAYILLNS